MQNYMNNFFIQSFIYTCKSIVFFKNVCDSMYKKWWIVKAITDSSVYLTEYIFCLINFRKMEPFHSKWISKCWMSPDKYSLTQTYLYDEIYKVSSETHIEVFSPEFLLSDMVKNYYYNIFYFDEEYGYKNKQTKIDPLYITKTINNENEPCYLVSRVINSNIHNAEDFSFNETPISENPDSDNSDSEVENVEKETEDNEDETSNKKYLQKSKVKFLSVQYKHPEMDEIVELPVSKEWLIVGNELFTPAFVLRMLSYQSSSYYFDSEYTIQIVDGEINFLKIKFDEYIVLRENSYEIKKYEPAIEKMNLFNVSADSSNDADSEEDQTE